MLFNSVEFVVFLACVFALYWLVFARDLWWRNLFLWAVTVLGLCARSCCAAPELRC
jgi:hypothetical protein